MLHKTYQNQNVPNSAIEVDYCYIILFFYSKIVLFTLCLIFCNELFFITLKRFLGIFFFRVIFNGCLLGFRLWARLLFLLLFKRLHCPCLLWHLHIVELVFSICPFIINKLLYFGACKSCLTDLSKILYYQKIYQYTKIIKIKQKSLMTIKLIFLFRQS